MILFSTEDNFKIDEAAKKSTKCLYRVLPIKYLLSIFKYKRLVLINPKKWEDPYENPFLKYALKKIKSEKNLPINEFDINSLINIGVFCLCCTHEYEENELIWKVYSDGNGARIMLNFERLEEVFNNLKKNNKIKCFIAQVKYQPNLKDNMEFLYNRHSTILKQKFVDLLKNKEIEFNPQYLLFKRDSFSYEKEVRIILYSQNKQDKHKDLYFIDINPFELIEEVLFDPRMDQLHFEAIKNYIEAIDTQKKIEIRKSNLYDFVD